MKFINKKNIFLFLFSALILSFPIFLVFGVEDFVPLTQEGAENVWGDGDVSFSDLVNNIYRYSIIISSMLAVIVITIGGFQYMGKSSYSQKTGGKERITNAIIGIIIIIGAVFILNIINPNIANLSLFEGQSVEISGGVNEGSDETNPNTPADSCNYTQSGCTQKCADNYGTVDTYDPSLGSECCKCK